MSLTLEEELLSSKGFVLCSNSVLVLGALGIKILTITQLENAAGMAMDLLFVKHP